MENATRRKASLGYVPVLKDGLEKTVRRRLARLIVVSLANVSMGYASVRPASVGSHVVVHVDPMDQRKQAHKFVRARMGGQVHNVIANLAKRVKMARSAVARIVVCVLKESVYATQNFLGWHVMICPALALRLM